MACTWLLLIATVIVFFVGCGKPRPSDGSERHAIELPAWSEIELPSFKQGEHIIAVRFMPSVVITSSPIAHRHFLRDVIIVFDEELGDAPQTFSLGEYTGNPGYRFLHADDNYGSSPEAIWRREHLIPLGDLTVLLQNHSDTDLAFEVEIERSEPADESLTWKLGRGVTPAIPDHGLRFHHDENPDQLIADLSRFEAQADYLGAQWYLDDIAYHFEPAPSLESMFKLRSLAYEGRRFGFDAVASLFEEFLTGAEDVEAQSQATALQALHSEAGTSLVIIWTSRPLQQLFLDGREMDPASNQFGLYYFYRSLPPGKHVLGLEFPPGADAPEVHCLWRTQFQSYIFDQTAYLSATLPVNWADPKFDAGQWNRPAYSETPFELETPIHAFLDLHHVPAIHGFANTPHAQGIRLEIDLPSEE